MSQKTFCLIVGLIFLVVAVLHFGMFVLGESATVFGQTLPVWSNLILVLVVGYFAYQGLRLGRKSQ